jgi:hypothetical protein
MPKFCPKCNTKAYDDTSFFCYKCGAQLLVQVPEKKKDRVQNYGVKVPVKEPIYERATAPLSPKPASVHPVKTIEICAQCGNPITDKNRIFCQECGANIREVLSGEMSSIVKHSVLEPIAKPFAVYPKPEIEIVKVQEPVLFKETSTPAVYPKPEIEIVKVQEPVLFKETSTPAVYPKPEIEIVKVQEPVLFKGTTTQGMGIPSYPKANKWRSIFILAGIALLFFILMLTLLLMFP